MKLRLVNFIEENGNWKDLLQSEPYNITIKENEHYMLFMYNQISSDFSNPIVKECRGLILRKNDYKPVCVPYFKFFNVQESNAAKIDWESAKVQEKVDGSIIKVWFDEGVWHISTNGTIDATDAEVQSDASPYKNYNDLFLSAENLTMLSLLRMRENYTYIFELVSPFNRVVVPYQKTEVYHTGTRNNITGDEVNVDLGVKKPIEYNLSSLDECLYATEQMGFDEEGFVVVDKYWNRVKIKSPSYVAAHHLKNNGVITMSRILDMIRVNEQDDFVAVYPEFGEAVRLVEQRIRDFIEDVDRDYARIFSTKFKSRKELALMAKESRCPSAIFSFADNKYLSTLEFLFAQTNERLLKLIGVE